LMVCSRACSLGKFDCVNVSRVPPLWARRSKDTICSRSGVLGNPDMLLQYVYLSRTRGVTSSTVPPSSYDLPSHVPEKVIGLPTCKVVFISVPKRYCFTNSGRVSASQTSFGGASTSTET